MLPAVSLVEAGTGKWALEDQQYSWRAVREVAVGEDKGRAQVTRGLASRMRSLSFILNVMGH